jgi:hypothetical protein
VHVVSPRTSGDEIKRACKIQPELNDVPRQWIVGFRRISATTTAITAVGVGGHYGRLDGVPRGAHGRGRDRAATGTAKGWGTRAQGGWWTGTVR